MDDEKIILLPTTDAPLMTALIKLPEVWAAVTDDSSPKLDEVTIAPRVADVRNRFLLVLVNGKVAGFFMLMYLSPGIYEFHTVLLGICRGALAISAAKMAIDWMFANTPALMLLAWCADYLPQTLVAALAVGGKKLGYVPNVIMKNGLPYGVTQMYMMKPEN